MATAGCSHFATVHQMDWRARDMLMFECPFRPYLSRCYLRKATRHEFDAIVREFNTVRNSEWKQRRALKAQAATMQQCKRPAINHRFEAGIKMEKAVKADQPSLSFSPVLAAGGPSTQISW